MYQIAIIGAGPAGLSAAARAAERDRVPIATGSAARPATCCWKASTPTPRRSSATRRASTSWRSRASWICAATSRFAAGSREKVLSALGRGHAAGCGVNVRYGAEVAQDHRQQGCVRPCTSPTARPCRPRTWCSPSASKAIRASSARRAKTWSASSTSSTIPKEFRDETILVVGAGDSAIENALALAEQNDVWIINRGKEFSRAKDANLNAVVAAIADPRRRLNCFYEASIKSVDAERAGAAAADGRAADARPATRPCECHRIIARLGADPAAQVRRVDRHQVSRTSAATPFRSCRATTRATCRACTSSARSPAIR